LLCNDQIVSALQIDPVRRNGPGSISDDRNHAKQQESSLFPFPSGWLAEIESTLDSVQALINVVHALMRDGIVAMETRNLRLQR
jgi:hypothetical protein